MTLTTHSFDSRLDMPPGRGQRSATFRFELLDGVTGLYKRELNPVRDSPPTLTHDTSRTIKRSLSSLLLERSDTAAINPVRDRVRVSMIIGDQTWLLGRYMFTNFTQVISTAGELSAATLLDEMFAIDQPIDRGFSARQLPGVEPTFSLEAANATLARLFDSLDVTYSIEPTQFSAIGSWPIGTNRGRIVEELALVGDYFSPWFDHTGTLRCIRAFDPAQQVPSFDWDSNNVIVRDTISYTNDLLSAPNRVVVVSNATSSGSNTAPITGFFDIPAAAPHSITNRGFVVADVRNMPVDSAGQATIVATNIGQRQTVAERVELDTVPDPRHDSYDVIRWEGANWLELSWALPLVEGSTMHHVMRKAYE